jgi:aspartyl protease family protein
MLAWAMRVLVLWIGSAAAALYVWQNAGDLRPAARLASPPQPAAAHGAASNALVLRADRLGHFVVDGAVNGAPTRFLVDTGASYVSLGIDAAVAAGIGRGTLRFSQRVQTANGIAMAAPVKLREVRIGQLVVTDVPAVVLDRPLGVALLGTSFLTRLDGYEMRDGELFLRW